MEFDRIIKVFLKWEKNRKRLSLISRMLRTGLFLRLNASAAMSSAASSSLPM